MGSTKQRIIRTVMLKNNTIRISKKSTCYSNRKKNELNQSGSYRFISSAVPEHFLLIIHSLSVIVYFSIRSRTGELSLFLPGSYQNGLEIRRYLPRDKIGK